MPYEIGAAYRQRRSWNRWKNAAYSAADDIRLIADALLGDMESGRFDTGESNALLNRARQLHGRAGDLVAQVERYVEGRIVPERPPTKAEIEDHRARVAIARIEDERGKRR